MIYIALGIFIAVMFVIIFEFLDKSIAALLGAIVFVLLGILTHKQAIEAIDFETIFLLMGMMMLIEISKESDIFTWLNVRIAKITRGNPLLILILFLSITALFSAFLDNVTTVLLIVPITIALTSGMGLDPTIYVIAEALFSNIGGALTLIGDPPNILIGSSTDLNFGDFISNLIVPVSFVLVFALAFIIIGYWKMLKPINKNLEKLFISNLLIKKITYKFFNNKLDKKFVITTLSILFLVFIGFFVHDEFGISIDIVAILGSLLLLAFTKKNIDVKKVFREVEWATLFFFAGLFIMVGGLEQVGLLEHLSVFLVSLTDNFAILLLIILWSSAFISMIFDNVPFVAVMIPVIHQISKNFEGNPNINLLWWALSLGACLGGNGTLIGASANIVTVDIAKKFGVEVSFFKFFKTAFPIMILSMIISSVYLLFRVGAL